MKAKFISGLAVAAVCAAAFSLNFTSRASDKPGSGDKMNSIYDFSLKDIDHKEVSLSQYRGKVVMIVNVASRCGFTPQYEGLQKLYVKYKDNEFVILGFSPQSRTNPSVEHDAKRRLSGCAARPVTVPVWPFRTPSGSPSGTDQIRTVWSREPEAASRPSGLTTTAVTGPVCPVQVAWMRIHG